MEHILTIRLQFEELDKNVTGPMDDAQKKVKELGKEATRTGAAQIKTIQDISQAWKDFDWAHPIESFKNVFGALGKWLQDRIGFLGKLVGGLIGGLVAVIIRVFKGLADAQAELVQTFSMLQDNLSKFGNYGTTIGQKVSRALTEISGVAMVTGESIGDISARFSQLAQARVPIDQVGELTRVSYLAAKSLGANVDQMTEFIGQLSVMGRLSATEISGSGGIIEKFNRIQDAVGLTSNEMAGLIETTSRLVRQMSVLGATTSSINALAGATAELTGIFSQLGLGASAAQDMMSKLFDPSSLSESALLISRMGYSMQEYMDMLAGGDIDQERLTSGMIRAAGEIERIFDTTGNIYLANSRAMALGFSSAADAIALAKEGTALLEQMRDPGSDYSWEQRAAEGMATLSGAFQRFKNRFIGVFGKALAPVVGRLTDIMETLEAKFIANESSIIKFFDNVVEGVINFIRNFNPGAIIDWFKKIVDWVKQAWVKIGEFTAKLKEFLPVIKAVVLTLIGLKVLSTLVGPIMGIMGAIKGIGGVAGGAGVAMGGLAKGTGMLTKILSKAGLAVLIMIGLAGAIWIMSQALKVFTEDISWAGMLKAIVTLAALTAAMFGLGLLFANPVGLMALAGVAAFAVVLAALSGALLLLAKAMMTFGEGAGLIKNLSEIGSPKLASGLVLVGSAINEFVKQFGIMQLLKSNSLMDLGKAMKDFAISFWVLGEIKDLSNVTGAMDEMVTAVGNMSSIRGRMRDTSEAVKNLTDSLSILAGLDQETFAGLGPSMKTAGRGIAALIDAMRPSEDSGTVADFFVRWGAIASAFKDLAIGIWILGETEGKMGSIARGIKNLTPVLDPFFTAFSELGSLFGGENRGLTRFADFLEQLGSEVKPVNLAPMIASMKAMPDLIDRLAAPLAALGGGPGFVGKLFAHEDIQKGVQAMVDLMGAASGGGFSIGFDEPTGSISAEVTEIGALAMLYERATQAQTQALIEKFDEIFDVQWKANQNEMYNMMTSQRTNRAPFSGALDENGVYKLERADG